MHPLLPRLVQTGAQTAIIALVRRCWDPPASPLTCRYIASCRAVWHNESECVRHLSPMRKQVELAMQFHGP